MHPSAPKSSSFDYSRFVFNNGLSKYHGPLSHPAYKCLHNNRKHLFPIDC